MNTSKLVKDSWATKLLILSFIVVMGYEIYLTNYFGETALNQFFSQYASSRSSVTNGNYISVLTSVFLHAGLAHIGSNSIMLYLAGKPLERHMGGVKFLLLFFISALVGSAAHILTSSASAVGASAGVSGVIIGAALLVPTESLLEEIPLARHLSVPVFRNAFSVVILGVYWAVQESFMTYLKLSDIVQNSVGHTAHFGGLIGGLLISYIMYPRRAVTGIKLSVGLIIILLGLMALPVFSLAWNALAVIAVLILAFVEWKHYRHENSL